MREKIFLAIMLLGLAGCATVPLPTPPAPPEPGIPGVYHRVEKGQTLWRISRMYNLDLDEIARINRISDASSIEEGRQIFIPHRRKQVTAIPAGYTLDDFIWPLRGRVVGFFGQTYESTANKGVNIRPASNNEVIASRAGLVVFCADNFGGFGKTLIIDHGGGLSSVYARNSAVYVKAGDIIKKGSVIARAGSSGRDKQTYLHFQIRKNHIPQNPLFYLPRNE